jgi:hypothetical protein
MNTTPSTRDQALHRSQVNHPEAPDVEALASAASSPDGGVGPRPSKPRCHGVNEHVFQVLLRMMHSAPGGGATHSSQLPFRTL